MLVSANETLANLRARVMASLAESGLENVCDSAYALNPGFTPNYNALTLELQHVAGLELRVVGTMVSRVEVGYTAAQSDVAVHAAVRKATRALMVGMRDQAVAWLEANPEAQP